MKNTFKKIAISLLVLLVLGTITLVAIFYAHMKSNSVVLQSGDKDINYFVTGSFVEIEEEEKEGDINILVHSTNLKWWDVRYIVDYFVIPRGAENYSVTLIEIKDNRLADAKSYIRTLSGEKIGEFDLDGNININEEYIKNIRLESDNNKTMSVRYDIRKIDISDAYESTGLKEKYFKSASLEKIEAFYLE